MGLKREIMKKLFYGLSGQKENKLNINNPQGL